MAHFPTFPKQQSPCFYNTAHCHTTTHQSDNFANTESLKHLASMGLKVRHHRLPCISTEEVWLATWNISWYFSSSLNTQVK